MCPPSRADAPCPTLLSIAYQHVYYIAPYSFHLSHHQRMYVCVCALCSCRLSPLQRTRHRPPPLALIPEGGGVAGPAAVRPDAPVAATAAASDATAGPVLGLLLVRAIPDVVFTDPEAKDRLVERLREFGSVRDVDLLPEYNAVRIR